MRLFFKMLASCSHKLLITPTNLRFIHVKTPATFRRIHVKTPANSRLIHVNTPADFRLIHVKMEDFTKVGKKILGAALNYTDILADPNMKKPKAPVMFLKPSSSYIVEGQDIVLPEVLTLVKHEVELGVVIGKKCRNVSAAEAADYIGGYCLGLDLSAFCELNEARKNGFPWSMGKGFDTSNPVSRFIPLNEITDCHNLDLYLNVNGERRQTGNTKDLIYNSFELISYLSKYMTLEPCDLIMTGTPKGASQIQAGDEIEAGLSESGRQIVKMIFNVK